MFRSSAVAMTACIAMALAAIMGGGSAVAQTIGTTTNPSVTYPVRESQPLFGQRIVAPGANLSLESFRFVVLNTSSLSVIPAIFEVTSGGANGLTGITLSPAPIWTGPATPITNSALPSDYTFTPPTPIALEPAKVYAITVRRAIGGEMGDVYTASDNYPAGNAIILLSDLSIAALPNDLAFSATFVPTPASVPTLSEWAMILLGVMLAGGAALTLHRRRQAA